MNTFVERQLETRAHARGGVNCQLRAGDAGPLLDDRGADAPLLELASGETAFEVESLAVVFDDEGTGVVVVRQADEHVARAAVLPHVDERFLDDSRELQRGRRGG